jgi:hypothetical protein
MNNLQWLIVWCEQVHIYLVVTLTIHVPPEFEIYELKINTPICSGSLFGVEGVLVSEALLRARLAVVRTI